MFTNNSDVISEVKLTSQNISENSVCKQKQYKQMLN